jgi:2-methylaconitate cis-trans-isomerase PrpF
MASVIAPAPWVRKHKTVRLPSVLMRSGTSRGLFLHRRDLPASESEWAPILISAMGSRNGDGRQLEGVGGATSTTSKVVVVSQSDKPGIDVEYTFIQIAVGTEKVDMSGNCGNMASGIAAFALDEGLVHAQPGETEVGLNDFRAKKASWLTWNSSLDCGSSL